VPLPKALEDLDGHDEVCDFFQTEEGDGEVEGGDAFGESERGRVDEFEHTCEKTDVELDLLCDFVARGVFASGKLQDLGVGRGKGSMARTRVSKMFAVSLSSEGLAMSPAA